MAFKCPEFNHPDFNSSKLKSCPDVKYAAADLDGVAPEHFHSTSMFPEYFKIDGKWVLAEESRMDSSVVLCNDGHLEVVENRNIKKGDKVMLGRTENGEDGIFVHSRCFTQEVAVNDDQFVFRQGRSRETSFKKDYDNLFDLLRYEKKRMVEKSLEFC